MCTLTFDSEYILGFENILVLVIAILVLVIAIIVLVGLSLRSSRFRTGMTSYKIFLLFLIYIQIKPLVRRFPPFSDIELLLCTPVSHSSPTL